ncbi:MAG: discoidin domain-containing protein [Spirochaetes bacterium]|nr:discoidin domain-containing protein [Spirochaetota bacterium]
MRKNLILFLIVFFFLGLNLFGVINTGLEVEKITASSDGHSSDKACSMIDGALSTRWESTHKLDPSWVVMCFKELYEIKSITLYWEQASAKEYDIQISCDGKEWQTVKKITDGQKGETRKITFIPDSITTQYLKILCLKRLTDWGYSIHEIAFDVEKAEEEFIDNRCNKWEEKNLLRKEILLNGIWQYIPDKRAIGEEKKYFKQKIDLSEWKKMKVPSNWGIENPDMFDYNGKVWYRQKFKYDKNALKNKVVRLQFYGIDYFAKIWLNGVYLGEHEGYFAPFNFEVKKLLKKENVLVVCVDSPIEKDGKKRLIKGILIQHDCRPEDGNTGGIWNDVKLLETGQITIENVFVRTKLNKDLTSAKTYFECRVNNSSKLNKRINIKISLKGKNFKSDAIYLKKSLQLSSGESKIILQTEIKNPELWWTWDHGKPNLYQAKIFIETDDAISDNKNVTFGIRKIMFDEGACHFYLNNKRLFQRGSNYIPTQWLSTYNKEKYIKEIQMMIDTNLNAVRNHAYVLPKEFYSACDEKGVLVWADFALIWICAEDKTFIKEACKQFQEYITFYYNHPSIWLWCGHNEGWFNPKLNKALVLSAAEVDKTRAINKDSGGSWDAHIYHGWYVGKLINFLDETPKFVTEYGAQGVPKSFKKFISKKSQWPPDEKDWRYHNIQFDLQERWIGPREYYSSAEEFSDMSLMYQYDFVKFATEQFRRIKYDPCGGVYHFMFVECWPSITWAVIDYYRDPKPAYYALKEAMSPILLSIKWEKRFFSQGDIMQASIWCINDYFYQIKDCMLTYEIINVKTGEIYQKKEIKLDLEEDSSKKVIECSFNIPSNAKQKDAFKLSAELKDSNGKILSKNKFVFRIKKEEKFTIDLSGKWFFKKGDDLSFAKENSNKLDWHEINVPGRWEDQCAKGYDGYAWYSKDVFIPNDWKDIDVKLYFENIDDCEEIYINGKKTGNYGSFPPNFKSAFGQMRFYSIPKDLIKYGQNNYIAIRIFDGGGDGGILTGPVKIGKILKKYEPIYIDYEGL